MVDIKPRELLEHPNVESRAISSLAIDMEGSTTIPFGSRRQESPKRGATRYSVIRYQYGKLCYSIENIFHTEDIMRACKQCGKVARMARGLCNSCYQKWYRDQPGVREKSVKYKAEWFQKNKDLEARKLKREQDNFDGKRELRLAIDDYTCQKCGSTTRLVVHHIDGNGRGSKTKNNSIKNLITLCKACHLNEHRTDILPMRKSRVNGYWAHNYDKCQRCGTREKKHGAHGLCVNCYAVSLRGR